MQPEYDCFLLALYYDAERLHIVPALGHLSIGHVTPLRIQTFLYQLQAEKHLSQRTISLNKGILVQIYDYAMELRLVESNPARNAKLPRQPRKIDDGDNKVIPIAQREQLLKAAERDPTLCPIITLLMLTGMRIGEDLALQWKHVDFQNRAITIQQSLTRELEFDGEGGPRRPPPPWASPRLAAPGGSSRYRIWSFSVCGSGCGMCPSGRAAWRSRCSMQWASTYSHSDIEASRRELR